MTTAAPPKRKRGRPRGKASEPERTDFTPMRLDAIRRGFSSDKAIAEVLNVSPAQLSRWRQGQRPDADNAARLAELDLVVELLSGMYSASRIPKWLRGPNAHLSHRTPLYHLRRGEAGEVIDAIDAIRGMAYA